MDELEKLRSRVDQLDDDLVGMLNERARLALEIGRHKAEGSVYVPAREKAVYEHLEKANGGPLATQSLISIYREIMSATIALQRKTTVAYFGMPGTFTHQAALKQFGRSVEYVPCPTIDDVFRTVEKGLADYGVTPVENSTEGGVNRSLDMFMESDLRITAEIFLHIHLHIMGASEDIDISTVKEVYSHPQPLAQSRNFLGEELHQAEHIAEASTAQAARLVKDRPDAVAIASEVAAEIYDLRIIRRNVEDNPRNITRFLVLGRESGPRSGKDKTSLLISIRDEIGALLHILEEFSAAGVNLTRIESRPSRRHTWDYVFFIDFAGHKDDPEVKKALEAVTKRCAFVDVIGSYPRAEAPVVETRPEA